MKSNNSLLYLLTAGLLAVIGFLIYYFFFSKKAKDNQLSSVVVIPDRATNPITKQTVDNPVYTPPVIHMPTEGKTGNSGTSANAGTFDSSQLEVLQDKKDKALSERTKNPGAIFWDGITKWQGLDRNKTKKNGIITFTSVDYGVRAQCMTLRSYSKNHGIKTLNALTARYAPLGHGDNNPIAYANTLAAYCNIGANDTFDLNADRNLLAQVAYYIHRVEAGYFWVPRAKFIEWANNI